MSPDQLRDLGHALDDLAKIRADYGIEPGAYYDSPRVALVDGDETWVLTWVESDNKTGGYYDAELDQ